MALASASYGDLLEVAGLSPMHTKGGEFTESTRPTLAVLTSYMDQVSAALNRCMDKYGLAVPATDAATVLLLDMYVNGEAQKMIKAVNAYGIVGPRGPARVAPTQPASSNPFASACEFVEEFIYEPAGEVQTRQTDERGNSTYPIFQRSGFGNRFTNWDAD